MGVHLPDSHRPPGPHALRGAVPPQTFPVPPGARTAVIQFGPGRLTAAPAERITFAVKPSGPEAALLEMLAPDGSSGGSFRRR